MENFENNNWDYIVVIEDYIIAECGQDLECAKRAQASDFDAVIVKRFFDEEGNEVDSEVVDDGYGNYEDIAKEYEYGEDPFDTPFDEFEESVNVSVNADSADEMVSFARALFGDNIDVFDQDFETEVPAVEVEVPAVTVEEPAVAVEPEEVVAEEPECEGEDCEEKEEVKEVDLTEGYFGEHKVGDVFTKEEFKEKIDAHALPDKPSTTELGWANLGKDDIRFSDGAPYSDTQYELTIYPDGSYAIDSWNYSADGDCEEDETYDFANYDELWDMVQHFEMNDILGYKDRFGEDYSGNPEERTTHLDYADEVPTDDKFKMPKNVTKEKDIECTVNKGINHTPADKKEFNEDFEEEDMSEEEFLEEFGKALAEKKNCKDKDCELKEDANSVELDFDHIDTDYNHHDFGEVYAIWNSNMDVDKDCLYVTFWYRDATDYADVKFEPDGEPTYVPYGSQSVMYDDGTGSFESVSVDTTGWEPDEEVYELHDNTEVSEDEFVAALGCTKEEFNKFLMEKVYADAAKAVATSVEVYIEDDPEDFRPDPDDFWDEDIYRDR